MGKIQMPTPLKVLRESIGQFYFQIDNGPIINITSIKEGDSVAYTLEHKDGSLVFRDGIKTFSLTPIPTEDSLLIKAECENEDHIVRRVKTGYRLEATYRGEDELVTQYNTKHHELVLRFRPNQELE